MAELTLDLHDYFPLGSTVYYDQGFKYDDARLTYDSPVQSDSFSKEYGLTQNDTFSLSDSLAKQIEIALSDQLGITDVVVREIGLGKADTLGITDSEAKAIGVSKSDTLDLADSLAKAIGLPLSDTLAIADTFSRAVAYKRSFTETLGITDSVAKTVGIPKTDTLNITDAGEVKEFGLVQVDTLTIADSLAYYVPDRGAVIFIGKEDISANIGENKPSVRVFETIATATAGYPIFYDSSLKYDTTGYYYDKWYSASGDLTQGERPKMTVTEKNVKMNVEDDKSNIVKVSK